MAREHFSRPIQSSAGDLLTGSVVRVLEPNSSTSIAETLYADETGVTAHENPFVATDGYIDFYLDKPKRVRIGITPPGLTEFFFDNVDIGDFETYRETIPFTIAGAQVVKQYLGRYYVADASRLIEVRVSAGTSPTGTDLVVDINKNGTSIFTGAASQPRVAAGSNTGVVAPEGVTFAVGDYITVDVDQIGSGMPGGDVVVQVRMERL